jgi:SAM-dependent methyltransferase
VGQLNFDEKTVTSFGDEWSRFDQTSLSESELNGIFGQYFAIFPWDNLAADAEGFDMGCGSGRWAKFVAPRVGRLNCVDPSPDALAIARRNLARHPNVNFINATANTSTLAPGSQDFGYSLGVLHHVPDTRGAIKACVDLLKPGAPFLIYLYYRFDNRPAWFRTVWKTSELLRSGISRLPNRIKHLVTDSIAFFVYWPLARTAKLCSAMGLDARNVPLHAYRDYSFYTMRTDSRDRFGTPLEQRFTRDEIKTMLEDAGLVNVKFSNDEPFWCAVGTKR